MATTSADSVSAYRWVMAYTVLGLILWGISKTRFGYTALYYLASIVLFVLILTQYRGIVTALSPLQPGGTTNGQS
jgi:hypothetical protein